MILLAGILDPIEGPLTEILEWLHSSIGLTWAWAIVVLTVMVRIVLVPLTIKQVRSMQRLQQYAPELKALQQKYKNDKQRLNEEVMKFYRENKVNPAASCLPILFQIPVFIALFYTLKDFEKDVLRLYPGSTVDFLHGVVPDITQNINDHWSGWLLLCVYVGSQLASTLLMATTMDRTQRILFIALPFVFIPFIINFPTGLMIYWVTTNLWTAGQGLVTRRLIPRTAPTIPKRTSKTPAKARPEDEGKRGQPPKATTAPKPKPAPSSGDGAAKPQQVRRRKKKSPRARR
jgi:YidC/Oxa1 family membrane protein insertase